MFEIKIEDVLESKETPEEREFLEQARRLQICDTIESLSDDEFVELQRSVHQVFMRVIELQGIVKEGIEKGETVGSIRNKLKENFQYSSENSFYYREQYLKIEKFLAELEEKRVEMTTDPKDIAILKCKFFEAVEQSNLVFQNLIQSSIYSREDVKKRIYSKDSQLEGTKDLAELCHNIRKELSLCVKDSAKSITTMEILSRIVQPLLSAPEIALRADTLDALRKSITASKKRDMLLDDEKDVLDLEVEELIHGLNDKFDLKKVGEVVEFVQLLKASVDKQEKERLNEVIERLEFIQNSSSIMFKIAKFSFKKEIIEILKEEQKYSHERRKNNTLVQDNTKEKELEKVQSLTTNIIQKEFGEGYIAENETEVLANLISEHAIDQAIEFLENLKERVYYRKLFADVCLPYSSLTRRIEMKRFIREGNFDDAMDRILAKISEKQDIFCPGKYNVNRVDLYEELASVRNVREEEVVDALLTGKAKRKTK